MKIGWRGALGFLLSAALLVFTLRNVSFTDVWQVLRHANVLLFGLAALCATLTFPLRALRWRVILSPVVHDPPVGPLWRAIALGAMVTNLVPLRPGELARAYAVTREVPQLTFAASIASLAVDRLFDSIVVLLLLLLAMLDPAFQTGVATGSRSLVTSAATIGAIGLAVVLLALYAVVVFPDRLIALYEAFARRLAPRLEERGRLALRAFADGLGVLRHPGRFAAVLAWTLVHWLMNAFAFWLGFRAVGIDVPLSAALLVQGLVAISVALPAAPGFIGVFEAAGTAALAFYGVGHDRAVSWALGYHALSFIPITIIGAVYFGRLGLHFRQFAPGRDDATVADA